MLIRRLTTMFAFATVAGVSALLGVLVSDRSPPFIRVHGEITPPNPKPGAMVTVHWSVQGSRECPGTVFRELIDSHRVIWTLTPTPVVFGIDTPLQQDNLNRSFLLPVNIAPGQAYYRVTTEYYCNPLHRWWPIRTVGPLVGFTIAPPEPAAPGERGPPGPQGPPGEPGQRL